jgi:hypothetical protein
MSICRQTLPLESFDGVDRGVLFDHFNIGDIRDDGTSTDNRLVNDKGRPRHT